MILKLGDVLRMGDVIHYVDTWRTVNVHDGAGKTLKEFLEIDSWNLGKLDYAERAETPDTYPDHPYHEACPKCWARYQSQVKRADGWQNTAKTATARVMELSSGKDFYLHEIAKLCKENFNLFKSFQILFAHNEKANARVEYLENQQRPCCGREDDDEIEDGEELANIAGWLGSEYSIDA